jgi:hypothetical protein
LLLALTNIVAIQVAFSAVLWVAGYRRLTTVGEKGFLAFLRRDSLGLAIVCILGTIFGFQLHNAISTAILEGNVRGVLRRQFDYASGFNIVDMRFSREPANPLLTVVLRGPKAPSAEKIAAAQANLPRLSDGSKLNLRLRFICVVILTPNGPFIHDGDSESGD